MSDALTEFLLARYAEDEVEIDSASGPFGRDDLWTLQGPFDPDRLRADIKAKRRIVEEHELEESTDYWAYTEGKWGHPYVPKRLGCSVCDANDDWIIGTDGCLTLREMAFVYADHPEYREEWRV